MSWAKVNAVLSNDDVLPAEGVQDVVDKMNGNRDALYWQHERRAAKHLDVPFLVGRALLSVPDDWITFDAKSSTTPAAAETVVMRAGRILNITPAGYFHAPAWEIRMDATVALTGGHACSRVKSRSTLTPVAPTVSIRDDRTALVCFASSGFSSVRVSADLALVHVVLHGVRLS